MQNALGIVGGSEGQPLSMQQQSYERMLDGLRRDFGVCMDEFENPLLQELMLNPDGRLWREVAGQGMSDTGLRMSASEGEHLFGSLAGLLETEVRASKPILECELPLNGWRFEGLVWPIVDAPSFSIRVPNALGVTLKDFEDRGILTDVNDPYNHKTVQREEFAEQARGKSHREIIELAVKLRKNILIIGGTASGKTTILNAISHAIATMTPEHRVIIIEDTREVRCAAPNLVQMRTNTELADVDMTRLLKASLRLRPDRIIVGEVRDKAALALLKMWNTGHPGGLATVHADDCYGGLIRLEQMIEENPGIRANRHVIAEAIGLCVFIGKDADHAAGRKVRELAIVEKYDQNSGRYVLRNV
ncbi:Flp pilus assembly complex ATPase component TadA [Paraburkholderia sacchari]|uniref:Flp pilus assembly complex ATPase component TadA n=2 Tax=Paraburkholderia sacchari TaxID=159450 RepID=A0A8T6ZLS0_9BURK|nr:Flp pilus assembly complex ATPase component TadA [Paraburkholderia sacchari]NLP65578.1 Flp pilus assembly complex ATPase component TadA [Paraburkholderia sacchari]